MDGEAGGGPLALGVECGGTRTTTGLLSGEDAWTQGAEHEAANLSLTGDDRLLSMFGRMAEACPEVEAVGVGMAGMRTDDDRQRVLGLLRRVWPRARHYATDDLENALAGSADRQGGHEADVLVVSGTGASCLGVRSDGTRVRTSGWGHLLGDESCGYGIGLAGLKLMVRELDRRGGPPPMLEQFLGEVGLASAEELVPWCQMATKAEIARAALHVFRAWEVGSREYGAIVQRAAGQLADDALACVARLGHPSPVRFLLNGGCFSRQEGFRRLVSGMLSERLPSCRIDPESPNGALGAARLAREKGRAAPSSAERPPPPAGSLVPSSSGLSPTERRNPASMQLHRMSVAEAIELMAAEDSRLPQAILGEAGAIAEVVERVAAALGAGGRLLYFGAGTSGRLGVLDASECPPTFRTDPGQVQGAIAGGSQALERSVEGAEDSAEAGLEEGRRRGIHRRDVVVGIAASGRTPYVWGALEAARRAGAATVLICFNPHLEFSAGRRPDIVICPDIGPEILTGSTRLKAGTATKMILNMITTLAMVRRGKVIENLMVDVHPTNAKLRDRAARILGVLAGMPPGEARARLEACGWRIPRAWRQWREERSRT